MQKSGLHIFKLRPRKGLLGEKLNYASELPLLSGQEDRGFAMLLCIVGLFRATNPVSFLSLFIYSAKLRSFTCFRTAKECRKCEETKFRFKNVLI